MTTQCIHCGNDAPADVWRCTACGRPLRPLSPPPLDWRPGLSKATTRLVAAEPLPAPLPAPPPAPLPRVTTRHITTSLIGLLFAAAFTLCTAEFLHSGGVPRLGLWPMGVLLLGGLLSQQAWVRGDMWRGLRGMGLWGGMTWLLATGRILPWTIVLIISWLVLLPLPFRKH